MEIIIDIENDIINEIKKCENTLQNTAQFLYKYFKSKDIPTKMTVIFVSKEYQRQLNKEYRNIDRTTDVLSFPADNENLFPNEEAELGELYIDPILTKKQSERHEVSFENELVRLLIHGFLHLLGYDHMTEKERDEMFYLQEELIEKFYE